MPTMVTVPISDTAQMRRLIEFASDIADHAGQRRDLELRELVDDLHRDLMTLRVMRMNESERDADRLELLDRLADRLPDLDLDQHSVEWIEMPDDRARR